VGQKLDTVGGKSKFILDSISDDAFYYQVSTNNKRKQGIKYVKRVLERYSEKPSLSPGFYTDITMNGSYVLALVKLYVKR
jgi:hypothetical protein